MIPDSYRDYFLAEAGASAALIGLLFVAMSVATERRTTKRSDILDQARASSALTAFVTALSISLVALLPGARIGIPAVIVSVAALLFVAATIRRYFSVDKANRENPRGLIGLVGFTAVTAVILAYGIDGIVHPNSTDPVSTISAATIACVLLGVDRAWALIGGHGRGRGTALVDLVRGEDPENR
jgi:hypothetical protein